MDYSKTVNLPKTDYPMKADLPKREPEILAIWEKEKTYDQALQRRLPQKGVKPFILHDGPPYANGHLHLGHALNKILKDIIVRYKTMAGYYAPYVPGWDCHGLPIELQLMKELGVDKHRVERGTFREQAAAFAQKFVEIQRQEFKRMGVLGDWDHPYLTMAEGYKRTIVEAFQELASRGYVYRGKKPVYWCATDETALAEAEVEYEDDPSPSIYVAFPGANTDYSLVIWTTTPWTLPANLAVAYSPQENYVVLKTAEGKKYVVAEKLSAGFLQATGLRATPMDVWPASKLHGTTARHPWIQNRTVPLLPAPFVAMDTGTGLVHIAPGHGVEDYQLGREHQLPVYSPVDDRGRFTEEVPEWKGLHVFKANPLILDHLKKIGALLHSEEITHSYPHCWRCHKPVLFRATEQWFLRIDHEQLRDRLMKAIGEVEWIPAYGKNRITGMVESRPDWCLSRQRLWGTEIPDGKGEGKPQKAEPDIVDVWFESGVSWAAVLKQRPDLAFPADMYLEGSDQHRGWFQTSLIPSVALEGKAPYRAVLTHGFVMDGQGRPMSKSLGNVISPQEIIKHHGADVLRLWVASSDYAGDVRLSPEIVKGLTDTYRKVRNTLRYLLNNLTDFDPARDAVLYSDLSEIDRWALHRLQEEVQGVLAAYQAYEFHRVSSRLVSFCASDLSGFYLDVLKDRLYCDGAASRSRRAAQTVLHQILDALLKLWAPVLSFTTDEAWRFRGHTEGVALADMPSVNTTYLNPALGEAWKTLLDLRQAALIQLEKARQEGQIKSSLQAQVTIYVKKDVMSKFMKPYETLLPSILLVSQVQVMLDPAVVESWDIKVSKADGTKCARCWIYKTDVGQNEKRRDLCARCAAEVVEWENRNSGATMEAHE